MKEVGVRDGFRPLIAPVGPVTGDALWFIFRDTQILVHASPAGTTVPACADPADLGVVTLRRQYLGMLGSRHCFSAEAAPDTPVADSLSWSGLRPLFGAIDDAIFALASRAVQIMDWDRSHQFCGRCGTPTQVSTTERARVCPACGHPHYPRIAPVVMALVRDGRRLLLARSPRFAPGCTARSRDSLRRGKDWKRVWSERCEKKSGWRSPTPGTSRVNRGLSRIP